jgi:hypothetical protein
MTGAVSFTPLTDGQLGTRRERLADFLDAWGDLRISDVGGARDRRLLEFSLEAPGEELPIEIRARYREYYRRGRRGHWDIAKYHYAYLDLARAKRLAYHLHDIGPRKLVPHAHCEDARDFVDEESAHHLRAVELDLREAHEEFMALWASDAAPDCAQFRPLDVQRII